MDYNYSYDYSDMAASGSMPPEVAGGLLAIFGAFMFVFVIIFIAVYVFNAICLAKIAKKTDTPNAWLAWIPIANVILMLQIAKKPLWWIILAIIPFVNLVWIVLGIIVWMAIAEAVKKPSWLGILMIIPFANIIVPAYLAFSKMEEAPVSASPTAPTA